MCVRVFKTKSTIRITKRGMRHFLCHSKCFDDHISSAASKNNSRNFALHFNAQPPGAMYRKAIHFFLLLLPPKVFISKRFYTKSINFEFPHKQNDLYLRSTSPVAQTTNVEINGNDNRLTSTIDNDHTIRPSPSIRIACKSYSSESIFLVCTSLILDHIKTTIFFFSFGLLV